MCDVRLLGEHLMRMGESLGMTTVPLTPGGTPIMPPAVPSGQGELAHAEEREEEGGNGSRAGTCGQGAGEAAREEGAELEVAGAGDEGEVQVVERRGAGGGVGGEGLAAAGEEGSDGGDKGLRGGASSGQLVTYRTTSEDLT